MKRQTGRVQVSLWLTLLALWGCEPHQYLAIPGTNAEGNITENISQRPSVTGAQRPVVTVSAGKTGLVVGERTTLHVDVSPVTALSVSQLMLMVLNPDGRFYGYWELDLSPAELAAGAVDLEVSALSEPPTAEWCRKDQRGEGTCFNEVDKGVTGFTVVPATASSSGWPGFTLPLTMPALTSGSATQCTFTFAQCCGASGALSCALAQSYFDACGCPSPSTTQGPHGDGTTWCKC